MTSFYNFINLIYNKINKQYEFKQFKHVRDRK